MALAAHKETSELSQVDIISCNTLTPYLCLPLPYPYLRCPLRWKKLTDIGKFWRRSSQRGWRHKEGGKSWTSPSFFLVVVALYSGFVWVRPRPLPAIWEIHDTIQVNITLRSFGWSQKKKKQNREEIERKKKDGGKPFGTEWCVIWLESGRAERKKGQLKAWHTD